MATYRYSANNSPGDRFDAVEIALDNGATLTLKRGLSYDLTAAELARARTYVVMSPSSDDPSPLPPSQGGSGVNYVATDAELPPSASGHPVVLVLADGNAAGAATLRYWSGSDWVIIGLAGGGTVSSDFIDVPANLAGIVAGRTLIWSGGGTEFIPGSPS